jgi:DNA-binding transcriptional LysR family regulator
MPIHAPFLKYFHEVAQCGSVRLAASHLFISSSAVNRQILNIEAELGTRLFDRTSKGMQLTNAGKLLFEHVERTLLDAVRTLSAIIDIDATGDKAMLVRSQSSVNFYHRCFCSFMCSARRLVRHSRPPVVTS